MISGAERGQGGRALSAHLLKIENEVVEVIQPRGLGSRDLHAQLEELVALSLGGQTDRPIYHVHADPDLEIADNDGARARWWQLFETEFGLGVQPFCGAIHVKHSRRHEHRIYSLVRPDGRVIDLRFDFARREKCSRVVEFEFGVAAVPSKHSRLIESRLRADGRTDVAAWLVASGTLDAERPVAAHSPRERLIQERTGIPLDDLRTAALAAWRESETGEGFREALRRRGLDLRKGKSGPVAVDASGTAHLVTRLIGAAARREEGQRIPAGLVRERLAGLTLAAHGATRGREVGRDHQGAGRPAQARGGAGHGAGAGRDAGGAHAPRSPVGADAGGGRDGGRGVGDALARIAARPGDTRLRARLRMLSAQRSWALSRQVDGIRRGERWIAMPGQDLDLWGIPHQSGARWTA